MPDCLLTVGEVAALLHFSTKTIYRRVASGDLPVVLAGGHEFRFRPEDVRDFIESRTAVCAGDWFVPVNS